MHTFPISVLPSHHFPTSPPLREIPISSKVSRLTECMADMFVEICSCPVTTVMLHMNLIAKPTERDQTHKYVHHHTDLSYSGPVTFVCCCLQLKLFSKVKEKPKSFFRIKRTISLIIIGYCVVNVVTVSRPQNIN